MDRIVWAQNIMGSDARSATPERVVLEHSLAEDDLRDILTVSLVNDREEANDVNQPQGSHKESTGDDNEHKSMMMIAQWPSRPHSHKLHRGLCDIGTSTSTRLQQHEEKMRHERYQKRLMSGGVCKENLLLLRRDTMSPFSQQLGMIWLLLKEGKQGRIKKRRIKE